MKIETITASTFSKALLKWYDKQGRKHLPWRQEITAYRVWLSEIMLQQTQVATVLPYFKRFIQYFPDVATLAKANIDEVLHLWAGLGYYARGRNLHRTAQIIHQDLHGQFPITVEELATLPGIGRSTAGAIAAIAYQQPAAILDGNVKRVLCRVHTLSGWSGTAAVSKKLWELAEHYVPNKRADDYTQALMDLGATICTRSQPKCSLCPLQDHCQAHVTQQTSVYPQSKPKKTMPNKHTIMLIISNPRGDILLEKRPPTGIWGGLWSLPECAGNLDNIAIKRWCRNHYGFNTKIDAHAPLACFKHTFSHFYLHIHPVRLQLLSIDTAIMETKETVWFTPNKPNKRGLSAPVQRLIMQSYDSLGETL